MTEQTIVERTSAHQRARILRDARETLGSLPTQGLASCVAAMHGQYHDYRAAADRQEAIGNGHDRFAGEATR